MQDRTALVIGGIAGLIAVLAGTFGAHGLEERLDADALEIFEIGVRYNFFHAIAIVACAGVLGRFRGPVSLAVLCFAVGIVIFPGSLYALAFTGQRWLGATAAFGGMFLVMGWASLIGAAWFGGRKAFVHLPTVDPPAEKPDGPVC